MGDVHPSHSLPRIGIVYQVRIVKQRKCSGSVYQSQIWNKALSAKEVKQISSGASVPYEYRGASQVSLNSASLLNNANYPISKILIGNKIDICNRVISYEEAEAFATEHNLSNQETSVKNNINVQNVFMTLCEDIYKNKDLNKGIVVNNESHLSLSSKTEGKNRSYYDCCYIS